MPFDESLAARVRDLLGAPKGLVEKRMFGGVVFLLHGNIAVGLWEAFLIVRVGPAHYEASLREPCVKEFDVTGRAMTGWVMVLRDGVAEDEDLERWLQKGIAFARTLPRKESSPKK